MKLYRVKVEPRNDEPRKKGGYYDDKLLYWVVAVSDTDAMARAVAEAKKATGKDHSLHSIQLIASEGRLLS